jgi:hypothetical protein
MDRRIALAASFANFACIAPRVDEQADFEDNGMSVAMI